MLTPIIRRQRHLIWNMLVEKQELKHFITLIEILMKIQGDQIEKTTQSGFSRQLLVVEPRNLAQRCNDITRTNRLSFKVILSL